MCRVLRTGVPEMVLLLLLSMGRSGCSVPGFVPDILFLFFSGFLPLLG